MPITRKKLKVSKGGEGDLRPASEQLHDLQVALKEAKQKTVQKRKILDTKPRISPDNS